MLLLGGCFLPETPSSLIERGRLEQGRKVLQQIRGVEDVDAEYEDIKVPRLSCNLQPATCSAPTPAVPPSPPLPEQYAVDVVKAKELPWHALFTK